MIARNTLKAVLLDVDGTLLDSNDAHARSWMEVLERHGHACAYSRVRPLIGKGGDKVFPELIGIGPGDRAFTRISDERKALFQTSYLPRLKATPGSRALLKRMLADGLALVVATSAGDELKSLLDQAGIEDLIEVAATSDDAEKSKPDPDIVQAALAKAGVEAHQAIMLGDTPYDIQAASAAGVRTVALRCEGWWKEADLAGAIGVYNDPADLLSRWPVL